MGRIVQPIATSGSQHWLQELVRTNPGALESQMGLGSLTWLSPLESDEYAEYSNDDFLGQLGVDLAERKLDDFWPVQGPLWDGLAQTTFGISVLVDANSHPSEMDSSCPAMSADELAAVRSAFEQTKSAFDVDPDVDWCAGHFEYASRLAQAYLMRELNGIPTELVFLYFIGDSEVGGPSSREEWVKTVMSVHDALGVLGQLPRYVHDVFIDLADC